MWKIVRARASLLEPAEAAADAAFWRVCRDYAPDVVGVWSGRPIHYPLSAERTQVPRITDQLAKELNWDQGLSPADLDRQLQELDQAAAAMVHQQVAYAGWLTLNKDYQREKQTLFHRWLTLASGLTLPFFANTHDREPVCVAVVDPGAVLPADDAAFIDDMGKFLRRWQVATLATWELPLPQGPLVGVPLGVARHLLGPDQVVTSLPNYYDTPSIVDLRKETQ
jgi:hypothetical protein